MGYVGNLPADMDNETFVSICGIHGQVVNACLIRAKSSGIAVFASAKEAQLALHIVDGFEHAGTKLTARPADGSLPFQPMRSWDKAGIDGDAARQPSGEESRNSSTREFAVRPHTTKLYVTGLPSNIDEKIIMSAFTAHGEVASVRVVWNNDSGAGCIVQMMNRWKAAQIVQELNGVKLPEFEWPLHIKLAETPEQYCQREGFKESLYGATPGKDAGAVVGQTARNVPPHRSPYGQQNVQAPRWEAAPDIKDEKASDLAVEGLPAKATKTDLITLFARFGRITGISWGPWNDAQACAFVQFSDSSSAEQAVENVSGTPLGDGTILDVWPRWMCANYQKSEDGDPTVADDADWEAGTEQAGESWSEGNLESGEPWPEETWNESPEFDSNEL